MKGDVPQTRVRDDRKCRFDVRARTDSELYWSAYLYCGLYQLVDEGLVTLSFSPRLSLRPKEIFATLLEVRDRESGQISKVAIDWRDNANILCLKKLASCDVYFKRNLIPEVTNSVCPPEFLHKLRPAGLSFAARTNRDRPLWVQSIGGLCSKEAPIIGGSFRETAKRLWKVYRGPVNVRSFLHIEQFESSEPETARNTILFQTKAYNWNEGSYREDTRAVTEERALFIRRLQELGDRFVGGFVKSPFALEHYADYVAAGDAAQSSYCNLIKQSRSSVYTRGLRDSPAFKLGEYLASGRCVLAQRLKTLLPEPLIHGKHLLWFDTAEELAAQARILLASPRLQQTLSCGALTYYENHVRPRQRVLQMLEQAFHSQHVADSLSHFPAKQETAAGTLGRGSRSASKP